MKNESLLLTYTLLLRYAFHRCRLFRHSKVYLLTCYVIDLIVITIIMAMVIRSAREQLA